MIVDSSAIVAILRREDDAAAFAQAIHDASDLRVSAATYVELVNVLDRRIGPEAVTAADKLLARSLIEIVPFSPAQARWARHARLTYGIGNHPARLNFGDCFAYALAKETGEALLFKGGDFALTDVVPAL
ncbi:MAG: type II toxin-antitoxin system VapC family toxin [Bauldia sp.]|nr:type II toxin-antitoxin system VapC family toxin [Bauldia sp.]